VNEYNRGGERRCGCHCVSVYVESRDREEMKEKKGKA